MKQWEMNISWVVNEKKIDTISYRSCFWDTDFLSSINFDIYYGRKNQPLEKELEMRSDYCGVGCLFLSNGGGGCEEEEEKIPVLGWIVGLVHGCGLEWCFQIFGIILSINQIKNQ